MPVYGYVGVGLKHSTLCNQADAKDILRIIFVRVLDTYILSVMRVLENGFYLNTFYLHHRRYYA